MSKIISVELTALDKLTPTLTEAMLNLSGVSNLSDKLKNNLGKLNLAAKINSSQINSINKYKEAIGKFDKATLDHQKALAGGVHKTIEKTAKVLEKSSHQVDKFKDAVGFSLHEFNGDLDKAARHFKDSNRQIYSSIHKLQGNAYRQNFSPSTKEKSQPGGISPLINNLAPYAAPAYLGYKMIGGYKKGVQEQAAFEKAVADAGTVFHAAVGTPKFQQLLDSASSETVSKRGFSSIDAALILKVLGQKEYSLDLSAKILPTIIDLMAVTGTTADEAVNLATGYSADLDEKELNRDPKDVKTLMASLDKFKEGADAITQMVETSSLTAFSIGEISPHKAMRKLWKTTNEEFFGLAAPLVKTGMTGSVVGTAIESVMNKLASEKARKEMAKYGISIIDNKTKENRPLISVLKDISGVLKRPGMKGREITFLQGIVDSEQAAKLYTMLQALSSGDFEKYKTAFGSGADGETAKRADIKQQTIDAMLNRQTMAWEGFFREVGNLFKPLTVELAKLNTGLANVLTNKIKDYLKDNKGIGLADMSWLGAATIPIMASLSGNLFKNSSLAQGFSKILGVGTKGNLGLFLASLMFGEMFSFGEDIETVRNIMHSGTNPNKSDSMNQSFKDLKTTKPMFSLPFAEAVPLKNYVEKVESTKTININAYGVTNPQEIVDKVIEETKRLDGWKDAEFKLSHIY